MIKLSPTLRIQLSLFLLRMGVFIVMGIWVIDKFVNPSHTQSIFSRFYMVDSLPDLAPYIIGGIQAIIVLAFAAGIAKRLSYGLVFIMHAISTFSTWEKMFIHLWEPPNLLFFTAWPMLAAIAALYLLRDQDNFMTIRLGK